MMRPAFELFINRNKDSGEIPKGAVVGVGDGVNTAICMSIAYCEYKVNIKLFLIDDYTYITSNFGGIGKGKFTKEQCKELRNKGRKNLKPFEDKEMVEWIFFPSPRVTCLFDDNSLDYVYIDANHEYDSVMVDLIAWYPKVQIGGIFSGHDYCFETKDAIDKFMEDMKLGFGFDKSTKDWWSIKL